LPSTMEVPPVEVILTEDAPSPLNPLGVKGAGEGGTVAVGAALANAVCDALGGAVEITELPLTPERVRNAAKAAAQGGVACMCAAWQKRRAAPHRGPVAQLDRAIAFEAISRRFESCRGRQQYQWLKRVCLTLSRAQP